MKKKDYIMENMTVSNCPKVTVIIYCSNRNNISLCVESIIEQTYKNIDIILINDTEENIDSTLLNEQLESERCVIYNNSQKNICSAIKDVLKDIDSDYISVIRDDCRMSVDYYRLLTRKSMEEECDIVLCDVAKYRDDGTSVFCQALFPEKSVRIPCFRQGNFPAFGGAQLRIPTHEGMLHPVAFSLKD